MRKRTRLAAAMLVAVLMMGPTPAQALTPRLDYSAAYEGSEYARRLEAVELSGNYREDLLRVALSQVGYHEGQSKEDKAGTSVEGHRNFTEYANAYFGMDGQWCAMFVSWCARQAGIPKTVINSACGAHIDNSGGKYGFRMTVRYKKNYTPVPGDLVFFTSTGWGTGHVGIVAEVSEESITTVEGNAMDEVRVRRYARDSEEIVYYGVYSWQEQLPREALPVAELRVVCSDGSNGTMPDGDPYRFERLWGLPGSTVTLPKGGFVREGYELAGYYIRRGDGAWYVDGAWSRTSSPSLVADGERVYLNEFWCSAGTLTAYCVWRDADGKLLGDRVLSQPRKESFGVDLPNEMRVIHVTQFSAQPLVLP